MLRCEMDRDRFRSGSVPGAWNLRFPWNLNFEFWSFAVVAAASLVLFLAPTASAHPSQSEPVEHAFVAGFDRFYALDDDEGQLADGGLLLLNELNCVACHAAPDNWKERLPGRAKLSLAGVGSRLSEDELWIFVRSPQHRKKGTIMPGMFAGEDRDPKGVEAIAAYLSSLKSETRKFPQGDVGRGRMLYHTVGCVACHEPAAIADYKPAEAPAGLEVEKPGLPSVPILLADKYVTNELAAFLKDPLSIRHAGRMPATELTDQEAADIAVYLQVNREPSNYAERTMLKLPKQTVEQGKAAFAKMNCAVCHDVSASESPASVRASKTLAKLNPDAGCISEKKKSGVPDYGLSDFQKRAIKLALAKIKTEAAPAQQTVSEKCDSFFIRMNCYACHEFAGKGGIEGPRGQYLTVNNTTVHSLGELGRLPPKLDVAGRKLTRAWFEKLLWGEGGGVRGYMTARMPKFGEANAAAVIPLLAEACASPKPVQMDTSGLAKHHRAELGRVLMGVGIGGMGCVSCHGLKDRKALGVAMINLTQTTERIQPEYFKELLLNPQATQLGTLMPPLFMGRKKANEEIESIWTYLKEIGQSRLPEGLLQTGDYELKPEKEKKPLVFRTFLEGAGMQAIAVGFPQQVHVAFDALEVRWALTWKGRFLDAQSTWEERAMTPAKALGENVTALAMRMPLAKLTSASDAWPETCGAAAGYVFKGYRIGKDGVPTFLYEVGGLSVEDTMQAGVEGKSLKRVVTVKAAQRGDDMLRGWRFLGLSKGAKPLPLEWKDGVAVIEEEVKL